MTFDEQVEWLRSRYSRDVAVHDLVELIVKSRNNPKPAAAKRTELLREAFAEALRRYPTDVEGALIFFTGATGIASFPPKDWDLGDQWG